MKRHLAPGLLVILIILSRPITADPFSTKDPETLSRMGVVHSAIGAMNAGRGMSSSMNLAVQASQLYNQAKFQEGLDKNSERRRDAIKSDPAKVPTPSPLASPSALASTPPSPSASPEANPEIAQLGKGIATTTPSPSPSSGEEGSSGSREQQRADALIRAIEAGEVNVLSHLVQQSTAWGKGIAERGSPKRSGGPPQEKPSPSPTATALLAEEGATPVEGEAPAEKKGPSHFAPEL